ncbi:MAG TPA: heterodisulfide reductase subunit B [Anaerolineae bacterium]|nr:heterodisulfide reductase subunit B [Anaerolineae bacterium]
MKYSYYPGCTAKTTSVEFGFSTEAVCEALGVELVELEDWSCCGASSAHSLNHELSLALPARNVALAQDTHLDLVTSCPACYQNSLKADRALREDEAWRRKMEETLDFRYNGEGEPRHLLDVLSHDLSLDEIRARVVKPLKGLKVAAYYGCVLVRPPEFTGWDDAEHPMTMDRLLEAVGAEAVDWSYKVDCCGASLTLSRGEIVTKLSSRIVNGAIEAGADCIATACGICQINLDTRQKCEREVPIFYFTELMGIALGVSGLEKMWGKHGVDPRPLLRERGFLA